MHKKLLFALLFVSVIQAQQFFKLTKFGTSFIGMNALAVYVAGTGVYKTVKLEQLMRNGDGILLNDEPDIRNNLSSVLEKYACGKQISVYAPQYWETMGHNGAALFNSVFLSPLTAYALSGRLGEKQQFIAETTLAHEVGHFVHNDCIKLPLVTMAIASATWASAHDIFSKTTHIQSKFIRGALWLGLSGVKNINDYILIRAYCRHRERKADYHVINHTKDNPQLLYVAAELFKNTDEKGGCFSSHPSDAERAQYFEEAAKKLEQKIKEKNKLD